jgi:hypothetical protein
MSTIWHNVLSVSIKMIINIHVLAFPKMLEIAVQPGI